MLDKDRSKEVMSQKWEWEYHPLISLKRAQSAVAVPEEAILYQPVAPGTENQVWFINVPLLPIDTVMDRMSARGVRIIQLIDDSDGYDYILNQDWLVTEDSVRQGTEESS